jgi:hypothetical protein
LSFPFLTLSSCMAVTLGRGGATAARIFTRSFSSASACRGLLLNYAMQSMLYALQNVP